MNDNGEIVPLRQDPINKEAYIWENVQVEDQDFYINRASEQVSIGVNDNLRYDRTFLNTGGILSDEMGLGKTVSMLALILLHRRKPHKFEAPNGLIASGATLIITPSTISHQWEAEIKLHAPTLTYTYYQGVKDRKEKDTTPGKLAKYDIVLTNYEVMKFSSSNFMR